MSGPLQVDVYVAPVISIGIPVPDPSKSLWSPISCTLIQGSQSAVLADTPINIEQTNALAEWIEKTAPGKTLSHIFITHAHVDHFAGVPVLLKRFPRAKVVATKRVADGIKNDALGEERWAMWNKLFPNGQLPQDQVVPEALPSPSNEFTLEGHALRATDVEHSDTHYTSFLHVPDLRLVVGGDIVYGECHQHFGEADTPEKRQHWLDALDAIAALDPAIVVAGHKRASQSDGPYLIEATKTYIRTFEEERKKATSAVELEEAMKTRYPARWNYFILDRACAAAFPK